MLYNIYIYIYFVFFSTADTLRPRPEYGDMLWTRKTSTYTCPWICESASYPGVERTWTQIAGFQVYNLRWFADARGWADSHPFLARFVLLGRFMRFLVPAFLFWYWELLHPEWGKIREGTLHTSCSWSSQVKLSLEKPEMQRWEAHEKEGLKVIFWPPSQEVLSPICILLTCWAYGTWSLHSVFVIAAIGLWDLHSSPSRTCTS